MINLAGNKVAMISISPEKLSTTYSTNKQGNHISKLFALIRDVLSRACGRVLGIKFNDGFYKCLNFKGGSAEASAVRYLLVKCDWAYENQPCECKLH